MSFSVSKTFQNRLTSPQFQYQQQKALEASLQQSSENEEKSERTSQPQSQPSVPRFSTLAVVGGGSRVQINSQYVSDMY